MSGPLKLRFEQFLADSFAAESIDASYIPTGNDLDRADYYLDNRRIVAEIKSLEADQASKGSKVIDEYLEKTGIRAYGTVSLSRLARNQQHELALSTTISRRMSRRVEQICSRANGQLGAEFAKLPELATGLLIILNEAVSSLHPGLVAERVTEFAAIKPRNIHFCLLVFESHKVRVNGALLPYPILIDLSRSPRQRRAMRFLEALQWKWAQQYGHTRPIISSAEHPVAYYPESITFGG